MSRLTGALVAVLLLGVLAGTAIPTLALMGSQRQASISVRAATLTAPSLDAPTTTCAGGAPSVQLRWAASAGARQWRIHRAEKPSNPNQQPSYSLIATLNATATSHTDGAGLTKNRNYLYKVTAAAGAWTAESDAREVRTPNC